MGGEELANHAQDPPLEDGSVDDGRPQRPRVGVHLDHDAGEGEHQDDKDEADHAAGLGLESVSKEALRIRKVTLGTIEAAKRYP